MDVLVVNAGSSSLKYQLLNVESREVLAKGACERIGLGESTFTSEFAGRETCLSLPIPNHRTAITLVLGTVLQNTALMEGHHIDAFGHRIVHGGTYFDDSCLVDDDVLKKIE